MCSRVFGQHSERRLSESRLWSILFFFFFSADSFDRFDSVQLVRESKENFEKPNPTQHQSAGKEVNAREYKDDPAIHSLDACLY